MKGLPRKSQASFWGIKGMSTICVLPLYNQRNSLMSPIYVQHVYPCHWAQCTPSRLFWPNDHQCTTHSKRSRTISKRSKALWLNLKSNTLHTLWTAMIRIWKPLYPIFGENFKRALSSVQSLPKRIRPPISWRIEQNFAQSRSSFACQWLVCSFKAYLGTVARLGILPSLAALARFLSLVAWLCGLARQW